MMETTNLNESAFIGHLKQSDYCCFQISPADLGTNLNCDVSQICVRKQKIPLSIVKEVSEFVSLLLCSKSLGHSRFYLVFEDVTLSNKNNNRFASDGSQNDNSFNNFDITDIENTMFNEKKGNSDSQNESVFGSPLKLQTIANLSDYNGYLTTSTPVQVAKSIFRLKGVSIQQARIDVLRKFFGSGHKIDDGLLQTVVVLCNGNDSKRTIFIGAHKEHTDDKFLLKTFQANLGCNQRVKLSSLQTQTLNVAHDYSMCGDYELVDKRDSQGLMLLQAQWSDHSGQPRISNLHSAKFSLNLAAYPGNSESPLAVYFRQLEEIGYLFNALRNGETPNFNNKAGDPNVMSKLQQLFTRIKEGGEQGQMSMICDDGKKLKLSPQRDSDFTDKVWTIMQQCTCYADMFDCLKRTLKALKDRELSVYVDKNNETTIAQLARQSSYGNASFPPLTGNLPLKIIVEIGLEKIKRDYQAILLTNGLCSHQELDAFMRDCEINGKKFDDALYDVESLKDSQMETLKKLHHCLELACLMDLNSEHLKMSSVVAHVLNKYKSSSFDKDQTFTVQVAAKEAALETKNISPGMIRREYRSVGGVQHFTDCCVSEIPEILDFSMDLGDSTSSSSSSILSESKEYYLFKSKLDTRVMSQDTI